jgi:hypothetical protein
MPYDPISGKIILYGSDVKDDNFEITSAVTSL